MRKKANTQMKKDVMDSSFYSQPEKPTTVTGASGSGVDNFGMGYKDLGGTPLPFTTKKSPGSVSQRRDIASRKNITGKGGAISMYKQKPKDEENKNFVMSDKAIKENHLLRSMRKLKQQDDKSAATRIGVGGKNENFSRMTAQLSNVRSKFGARSTSQRPDSKEQKIINQMYQKQSQPDVPGDLKAQFGGVAPSLLLAAHKGEKWMKKRNLLSKTEVNRKHVEFAKNLFLSWDDDGTGELQASEIIKPLIAMGLSADSKFVHKLLQALDISNKKKKTDMKLSMLDFIKIFKSDKFSEQISSIISREIHQENLGKISIQHAKMFAAPTPEPHASLKGGKNISIAMKTGEKGIIEIPINSHMEGTISVYKRELTKGGHVRSKKTFKVDDRTETLIEENYESKSEEDQSKS